MLFRLFLFYITGVLLVFIVGMHGLHKERIVKLSMLFDLIVFSALSWLFFFLELYNRFSSWMTEKEHDPILWEKDKD